MNKSLKLIKIFVVLFILSLNVKSEAQNNILDSVRIALREKPTFFVAFHNRNTVINVQRTKLYGIVGGFDFNKKIKLYLGVYGFVKPNKLLLTNHPITGIDSVYRSINTENISIGADYTFYTNKKIYLSIPFQLGIGSTQYKYWNLDQNTLIKKNNYITVPIEIGTNAYMKILPFAALKGGIGYRFSIGQKEVTRLTSPYYNIGMALLIGEGIQFFKNLN
ncbi:MAG: hypothetical protein P8I43_00410 [Bacteroidia bacterium]|nr:hypothetical protein [Bacteroidia bacterium]MDG2041285.1 hypothetical protein [Bacteroidia bacterium]|tara:strand:- start:355 stop:1014 length:660 start_codon:yes stop_codon:yes gene_type:complete